MLKIGIDIGGVISKYPDTFRKLINKFQAETVPGISSRCQIYIISDMHDVDAMHQMLKTNDIAVDKSQIFSADYATYGEFCKTKLCQDLEIDILIDDFIGYVAEGDFIRLLVMPNTSMPYYSDSWKTDGSEGDFGRRVKPINS